MNIKFTLLSCAILLCTAFCIPVEVHEIKGNSLIDTLHFNDNQSKQFVSAHRGGRYIKGLPENAIATFEHTLALVPGAFLEMDVSITADGVLILMHDNSLERTTTASGVVAKSYWSDISNDRLIDDFGVITPYRIPKFIDVLKWAKPLGIIIKVDIKRGVPYEKVIRTIEKYDMKDNVILITYSIEGVKEAYELTQEMMISASIRNMEEWRSIQKANIPSKNLIAFTGTKMSEPELYKTLHDNGILCILGTMGNIDNKAKARGLRVYHDCLKAGVDILATDNPAAVAASIRSYKK